MPSERAAGRRSLVGRVVADRYRVVRVVSAGANALIVDAADLEADRPVTLKLVRPELAESDDFRRDFRAEMEVISRLSHPNLATVHDWGQEVIGQRTTVFVVVEYLAGGNLRDLFDRGRLLTPSQALLVGLEACRGLDFAHRQGLVHTELSPAKIVFGDDRRLRIVDFGLARLLGRTVWANPALVATHVASYSSPEQALGQPVDGKTDVYSLALILSEAVSGTVPFAADSTVATLSARIGRLMPVSADLGQLAAIFERAGRPEPAERATAAEFGRSLVRAAEHLPRPAPLPIVVPGPFVDDPEHLRRPNDPTGGIRRPPDEPPGIALVPPPEAPVDPLLPKAAPTVEESVGQVQGVAATPTPEAREAGGDEPAHPAPPGLVAPVGPGSPPAVEPDEPGAAAEPPRLYDGDEDLTIDELAALAAGPPPPPPLAAPPIDPAPELLVGPDGRHDRRRRRWRRVFTVLGTLAILAALGGLGYLAYRLFQAPTHEVPPLEGLAEAEALAAVAAFDWNVEVQAERSDAEPDIGDVIRTAPGVGELLGEGEPFLVVVSEGPELRTLPEIAGRSLTGAETALAEQRLVPLPATREFDEEVPAGDVISWSVADDPSLVSGDEVLPDTEVALVVSAGPEPRTVPELVGVTVVDSRALLDALRLEVRLREPVFSDDIPRGAVVRVRPEAGSEVERGSTVNLVPSKGVDLVTVPNLEGSTVNQARRRLQRAGLETGNLLGSTSGRFVAATVDGEDVEAGERIKRGTPVDMIFL